MVYKKWGGRDSNSVTGEKSTKVLRFFTTLILDDESVTLNLFLFIFLQPVLEHGISFSGLKFLLRNLLSPRRLG